MFVELWVPSEEHVQDRVNTHTQFLFFTLRLISIFQTHYSSAIRRSTKAFPRLPKTLKIVIKRDFFALLNVAKGKYPDAGFGMWCYTPFLNVGIGVARVVEVRGINVEPEPRQPAERGREAHLLCVCLEGEIVVADDELEPLQLFATVLVGHTLEIASRGLAIGRGCALRCSAGQS